MIMILKQLIYLALNMLSLIWLFVGPEAFLCLPRPLLPCPVPLLPCPIPLLPCPIPPPLPPKKYKAKSPLSFSFAKQLRESILFSASPFQVLVHFCLSSELLVTWNGSETKSVQRFISFLYLMVVWIAGTLNF